MNCWVENWFEFDKEFDFAFVENYKGFFNKDVEILKSNKLAVCEVLTKSFFYLKGACMTLTVEYDIIQMPTSASYFGTNPSSPI